MLKGAAVDFRNKISSSRYYQRNVKPLELSVFESDRGRIINSAAVRRLQQKTQVFPLERNSAVRSRLTHSMEVQQVGRFIVQTIFARLEKQELLAKTGLAGLERHVESLVEMACLMHDIGNPPFGHFGEQAINDWFGRNLADCYPVVAGETLQLPDDLVRDICGFEGNAQAIRLVHSLLNLNLTFTQVAGILKYTRCGTEPKPTEGAPGHYLKKKVGFYFSEQAYVNRLCDQLHMEPGCRHPLSYIMEAADDISYCIADLEDAVEKDILDLDKLSGALKSEFADIVKGFSHLATQPPETFDLPTMLDKAKTKAARFDATAVSQFFIEFRLKILHPLVQYAAERFINNIDAIYHGHLNEALLEDNSYAHAITKALKNVAFKYAFCDKEVEARELQGYKVITGLLDIYRPLLQCPRAQFNQVMAQAPKAPLLEKRLFKKLSGKHVHAYSQAVKDQDDATEFYYRCRLLQDYVSGMTDQFAYDEYRALMVID